MHVPSGNIRIGSLSGSSTCSLNLKSHMDSIWGAEDKLKQLGYHAHIKVGKNIHDKTKAAYTATFEYVPRPSTWKTSQRECIDCIKK